VKNKPTSEKIYSFIRSLTVLLAFGLCHQVAGRPPARHALIIAISDYGVGSPWSKLHSGNDVPLISTALQKQGFLPENIRVLRDEQASREGIINALTDLACQTASGDMVVVHYSGHGQQIFDNNGDEPDKLDEAWVLPGAKKEFTDTYQGQAHLRDDLIGHYIHEIRKKVGTSGQVLVIMDSCSSGTGLKGGYAKARGGAPPMIPVGQQANPTAMDTRPAMADLFTSGEGLGGLVFISATGPDELNHETLNDMGQPAGPLSYAFFHTFSSINEHETYRSLFARMARIMAGTSPGQHPQLEGDADMVVFDGRFARQQAFITVREVTDEKNVVVNGGIMAGLTAGARIDFYPAGTLTPQPEALIAAGTVKEADYFQASVALAGSADLRDIRSAWGFVVLRPVTDYMTYVNLEGLNRKAKNKLISDLSFHPLITLQEAKNKNRLLIEEQPGKRNTLLIKTNEASFFCPIEGPAEQNCSKLIDQWARGEFLKELQFSHPDYQITLDLVPARPVYSAGRLVSLRPLDPTSFVQHGMPGYPQNVKLLVKVTNTGNKKAWFNILDIEPGGKTNVILPDRKNSYPPVACVLEAGESMVVPDFYVNLAPPTGVETFKIVTSSEPLDLEMAIAAPTEKSKNSTNPMEKLLGGLYHGQLKGLPKVEGSASNVVFRILD